MSTSLESETDWDFLETQFDDGGNGGDFNDDGDDGGGWEGDDDDENPKYEGMWIEGLAIGGAVGWITTSALAASGELDSMASKHVQTLVKDSKTATEQGQQQVFNEYVEIGGLLGPVAVLAALGAVIGKKIENRLNRNL